MGAQGCEFSVKVIEVYIGTECFLQMLFFFLCGAWYLGLDAEYEG